MYSGAMVIICLWNVHVVYGMVVYKLWGDFKNNQPMQSYIQLIPVLTVL